MIELKSGRKEMLHADAKVRFSVGVSVWSEAVSDCCQKSFDQRQWVAKKKLWVNMAVCFYLSSFISVCLSHTDRSFDLFLENEV